MRKHEHREERKRVTTGLLAGGCLVRGLVVARGAAGFAVEEAVGAKADVKHGLAEAAVLLALAAAFRLLALRADDLAATGSGTHEANLSRPTTCGK